MKDDKILQDEIMSEEELDNVTGGTYDEYFDLDNILPYNNGMFTISDYRGKSKEYIQNWLKSNLNIDAKINAEFTLDEYGRAQDNIKNVYSQNGQSLTHAEVIQKCKTFLGK